MNTHFPTVTVRGLSFVDADPAELNELLQERLLCGNQTVIFTPNAKMGADALCDPRLHALLRRADLLLPDGAGVLLASHLHADRPLRHRLPGIEAGEMVLYLAAKLGLSVYFFGSEAGIADKAAAHWQKRLPALVVAGCHHGYVSTEQEQNRILQDIRQSGAKVLLVCLGFPAQEKWIDQNRTALPHVRLLIGLGGSFDVWAGKLRRAPRFFRALRMEWLWRMLRQPRRFAQIPTMLRYVFGR